MSNSVQMPALGESVTEGTVTRWLKSEGDQVEVDEPLLEVSTDKVDTEIPSPYGGVLEKILIAEDETAEVGADLAIIGDGSGASGGDSGDAAPSTDGGAVTGGSGNLPPDAEGAPEPEPEAAPAGAVDTPAETPSEDVETPAEKPTAGTGGSTGSGTSVTLPEMGESVTEGTVTRWLKAVGDEVALDEPLLEISTDKVDTEIPSPVAGTLLEITVGEDETIEVGAQLGVIGDASCRAGKGARAGTRAGTEGGAQGRSTQGSTSRPEARSTQGRGTSSGSTQGSSTQAARTGHPVGAGPRRHVRHAGDPQAGRRRRRRPDLGEGHRGRRPDPARGRRRRCRRRQGRRGGSRRSCRTGSRTVQRAGRGVVRGSEAVRGRDGADRHHSRRCRASGSRSPRT